MSLGNGISQPIRTFTDSEALEWIKARGEVNLALSNLAQQFRWPYQRVHRLLEDWEREGTIDWQGDTIVWRANAAAGAVRPAEIAADQRETVPAVDQPSTDLQAATESATDVQETNIGEGVTHPTVRTLAPSGPSSVQSIAFPARVSDAILASALPVRSQTGRIAGWVLGLAALSLALVALAINARFMWGFGRTQDAAAMLAILGFVIDLLAVVLPTVAMEAVVVWSSAGVGARLVLLGGRGVHDLNGKRRMVGDERRRRDCRT